MTEAAHLKIVTELDKCMEGETPVGELLFKFIMQKTVMDKWSTDTYLRENLTNLDTYMATVNLDIKSFNQYAKGNVDRTDDLMINLFKAYQVECNG